MGCGDGTVAVVCMSEAVRVRRLNLITPVCVSITLLMRTVGHCCLYVSATMLTVSLSNCNDSVTVDVAMSQHNVVTLSLPSVAMVTITLLYMYACVDSVTVLYLCAGGVSVYCMVLSLHAVGGGTQEAFPCVCTVQDHCGGGRDPGHAQAGGLRDRERREDLPHMAHYLEGGQLGSVFEYTYAGMSVCVGIIYICTTYVCLCACQRIRTVCISSAG